MTTIGEVRSGGQTGADRAALDTARTFGVPTAGWCPAGGWAEDHPDAPGLLRDYPELRPTPDRDPRTRTMWNVRDADATVVVIPSSAHSPGTTLTCEHARALGRPLLVVTGLDPAPVVAWLATLGPDVVLNCAGPRESQSPGVYAAMARLLTAVFGTFEFDG
ncbi:MAG: putative molybdenum carrier protein [Micrococcales bacterium]|nr:putative molybdenum carrier protein [Micrococcales bacterium]